MKLIFKPIMSEGIYLLEIKAEKDNDLEDPEYPVLVISSPDHSELSMKLAPAIDQVSHGLIEIKEPEDIETWKLKAKEMLAQLLVQYRKMKTLLGTESEISNI